MQKEVGVSNYFFKGQDYLRSCSHYPWQWSENAEVIEWLGEKTIVYRDDLINLLRESSLTRFPSLSSLVIVLGACNGGIHNSEAFYHKIRNIFYDEEVGKTINSVLRVSEVISSLPKSLRSGRGRIHLIDQLFEGLETGLPAEQLKDLINEFNSGRLDKVIVIPRDVITKEQLINEFDCLQKINERFPDAKALELKLRTGLDILPDDAPIEVPEPVSADFWQELSEWEDTRVIARIARQLIPVLDVPMHTRGHGDQPFGGISDITNKGNYDSLLLTELAQDDAVLTARLINNEALYLKREEPPPNPEIQRTILIDVSLKMWGIPKVFAVSAALAFFHNSKSKYGISAYTLGGEEYVGAEFGSRPAIVNTLEHLQASLHCGPALEKLLADNPASGRQEYIFITDDQLLTDPEFMGTLQRVKASLAFIITVARSGGIRFFSCRKGNLHLINEARLDLPELLSSPGIRRKTKAEAAGNLPAFFSLYPYPLLFPVIRLKWETGSILELSDKGLIAVSHMRRVFLLKEKKGAVALIDDLDRGKYLLSSYEPDIFHILVINKGKDLVKFYNVNTVTGYIFSKDLSTEVHRPHFAIFRKNSLYLVTAHNSFRFNCVEGRMEDKGIPGSFDKQIELAQSENSRKSPPDVKGLKSRYYPFNMYNVMLNVKHMAVDVNRHLVIGKYTLRLTKAGNQVGGVRIWENKYESRIAAFGTKRDLQPGSQIKRNSLLTQWKWKDGSTATVDSRGFMHLKSADQSLSEVTIVLVTGMDTALWASDGTVAGHDYFIPHDCKNVIKPEQFYQKYIQPFIDHLQ
jgi:hypothetical protein